VIRDLKYEAEIHHQLRYPNIVTMLGIVFEQGNYGIILEYVPYGSWPDFLAIVTDISGKLFYIHLGLIVAESFSHSGCGSQS